MFDQEKWNLQQLEDRIAVEGFEYAILDYSKWKKIKSEKFHNAREAYAKAKEAMEHVLDELGVDFE